MCRCIIGSLNLAKSNSTLLFCPYWSCTIICCINRFTSLCKNTWHRKASAKNSSKLNKFLHSKVNLLYNIVILHSDPRSTRMIGVSGRVTRWFFAAHLLESRLLNLILKTRKDRRNSIQNILEMNQKTGLGVYGRAVLQLI